MWAYFNECLVTVTDTIQNSNAITALALGDGEIAELILVHYHSENRFIYSEKSAIQTKIYS